MKFLAISLMFTSVMCSTASENGKEIIMENNNIIVLVQKNEIEATEIALKNGANVNTVDKDKRSLLLIATNNKEIEMAQLLVKYGADVNQQANNLDSPFLYAGASGQTELVKLFLDNGARFDIFNRYYGTALIPACERGHVEVVKLLASTKNFPINHVNRLKWTGLMEAVVLGDGSKKYQEIVQILKNAGAKDIPDGDGITALQYAERRGYKEIIKILK